MNKKVDCILSIDWEGNSLEDQNLLAMQRFSKKFPQIPKLQFLSPAYSFNLTGLSTEDISQKMRSAIGPNDEFGLHIHPWENFVKAAGVAYRPTPSYLANSSTASSKPLSGLFGGDVPLTAYNEEEIDQLITFSLKQLNDLGFSNVKYFRGGGWVSGPKVFDALARHGIHDESSPVPPEMISGLYPNTLIQELASKNWTNVSLFSRPFVSRTDTRKTYLYPNNVCLADYVDEHQAFEYFESLQQDADKNNISSIYFHFGWHQESAVVSSKREKLEPTHYLDRVEKTIDAIVDYCNKHKMELVFPRLADLRPS